MAQLQSQHNNKEQLDAIREQLNHPLIRLKGRLRKLRQDKGFGFIAGDDGVDYFFHWSVIVKNSMKEFRGMELRDRVEFSPINTPDKGPRAIEVCFIPEVAVPES